ncbi:MAG TPA: DUF5667 domain-containing protein [Candidatus Peribacterales bacterium]|nr:DUF5667 domain-containing protein [Candidatus Peribacterales bacterium]
MAPEHFLTRLAKTAYPSEKNRIRSEVMRRIEGGLLVELAAKHSLNTEKLRKQVLGRIAYPSTANALSGIRDFLSPSLTRMMELRAEILERIIHFEPIPTPLWQRVLKPIAVTVVFALVLRFAPTLFIASPLHASAELLLLPTQGEVSITDGAAWSIVEEQLSLDHPVTIRTNSEGAASIVLRDAVIRLAGGSEVTLSDGAFAPTSSEPLARVAYGQVWITSFLPEALLAGTSITLPQGILALKEGSVSVLADPEQSTVQVFDRYARVLPTGDEPIHLMQGDQLVLLPSSETQRHLITPAMQQEPWVEENLSRDAVHRNEIVKQKQADAEMVAGILPDSAFYFLKIASEQIDLGLTLGGKARQEKKIQFAATRMNEAVALLKAGKKEEAKIPLLAYREAIRAIASVSEEEARALLSESLVASTSVVADALPHSDLYAAKETVLEAAAESETAEISTADVDLYLLSDALLEIDSLAAQGKMSEAESAWNGIEGTVAGAVEKQTLGEIVLEKDSLKVIKTILRSIAISLMQAEELVPGEDSELLASLQSRVKALSPLPAPASPVIASTEETPCMSPQEITRQTNRFLAAVFTYQTSRAQRNEVLHQIALLPDCRESGQVLAKVMNKVPVFTRSFVWEALQKIDSEI